METNYRIAYTKFWQDVKAKDPFEIARNLSVVYNLDSKHFEVQFFGAEYILDCVTETIYRKKDDAVPEIMASIIMLNYLAYAGPHTGISNRWVSLKEIPSGVLFYPAFHKTSIKGLISTFGSQGASLLRCASDLGGQPAALGDASVTFHAFPEIPLCVIVWEGDDEVPSNATILYDPSIENRLHIESIIGLGMYLASQLKKLARK